jgi:hypothetical protein
LDRYGTDPRVRNEGSAMSRKTDLSTTEYISRKDSDTRFLDAKAKYESARSRRDWARTIAAFAPTALIVALGFFFSGKDDAKSKPEEPKAQTLEEAAKQALARRLEEAMRLPP